MKKLIIILTLAICSLTASADKWYIATTGSDTNGDGSSGAPWLTLKHAADTVTGTNFVGDTIMVGAGTFTETAACQLGLGVSIYGAGVTSIISSTYASTYYTGAIELKSSAANPVNGNQSISYIKLDGNSLTALKAIIVGYRNNVSIHHCTIEDFHDDGIQFYSDVDAGDGWTPSAYNYATDNKVYDCTITNCSDYAEGGGLIKATSQERMLVYNNILTQTGRGNGANGDCMDTNYMKAWKIYNNTFTKDSYQGAYWNFFMETWHWEGNGEIYNNNFYGHATCDLSDVRLTGAYTYGMKVYGNQFINSGLSTTCYNPYPISIEGWGQTTEIDVYNNLLQNTIGGISVVAGVYKTYKDEYDLIGDNYNISNIKIHNNILRDVGYANSQYIYGIQLLVDGDTTIQVDINNIDIYNNDIVGHGTKPVRNGIYMAQGNSTVFEGTDFLIANNIIRDVPLYGVVFYIDAGNIDVDTIDIIHNIFYEVDDTDVSVEAGVDLTNYTNDDNLTATNPLFVSLANYHLQVTSPAINAGVDVGLTTDFDGNLVGTSPDIGVYEYGTTEGKYVVNGTKYQMYNGRLVVNR